MNSKFQQSQQTCTPITNSNRLNFTHDMTKNIDERASLHFKNLAPFQYKNSMDMSSASTQADTWLNRSSNLQTPIRQSKIMKMNFIYAQTSKHANNIENKPQIKPMRDKNESSFNRSGFTVEAEKQKPIKKIVKQKNPFNTSQQIEKIDYTNGTVSKADNRRVSQMHESRFATPKRDPILEGDMHLMTSGKKHTRDDHSNSSKHNKTYNPALHFHTAAVSQDISERREKQLIKKFQSNVLSRQENLNPKVDVIDQILNDRKAWKNDSKDLFLNLKRKSEANWTKPTIQSVIKEVEFRGRNNNENYYENSYKITNPKIAAYDTFRRSASRNIEDSNQSFRKIQSQHRQSNIFN
eukprot:403334345